MILLELRSIGCRSPFDIQHQAAVTVLQVVIAAADGYRFPLIILGRTEAPLDDARAVGGRSAFHGQRFTTLTVQQTVIAAVGWDKLPLVILGRAEAPQDDRRAIVE